MKILVTYFSQTGNTEKIANAIFKTASQENDADLKSLETVDASELLTYDLVFLGSPIHGGSVANDVKAFLDGAPNASGVKLAGFVTHAAPAYPKQALNTMIEPFESAGTDKGFDYVGSFNCQGYLADVMHEAVKKMQNANDADWQENVKQMTGHPNDDDVANAIAFAETILSDL